MKRWFRRWLLKAFLFATGQDKGKHKHRAPPSVFLNRHEESFFLKINVPKWVKCGSLGTLGLRIDPVLFVQSHVTPKRCRKSNKSLTSTTFELFMS